MSSCFCEYDPPSFHAARVRTARKPHRCEECGCRVQPGDPYERVVGVWDGDFQSFAICALCRDLRRWVEAQIPCFCWGYGNMLEDAKACIEDARFRAPEETRGVGFGFGRRLVAIDRRKREARRHAA